MKLKLNRDHFSNGLAIVSSIVAGKASLPILANVLIEASKGRVSLSTTNLDLGIRATIAGESATGGAITLPVKRLTEIVRELPSVDVTMEVSAGHHVKLTSGGSTFKIMGIGKEEFPPIPEPEKGKPIVLSQENLQSMIRAVEFAQSTDEARFILNGVLVAFKGRELSLVATDGRRLALAVSDIAHEVKESKTILPARTVAELKRLLGKGENISMSLNDRRASFVVDTDKDSSGLIESVYLHTRVVEGNYPNYAQVIPKDKSHRVLIDRELLLASIHRAALVCTEKSNSVQCKFSKNLLEISAKSPDFGEAHESLAISFEGKDDVRIAFNPKFTLDPLNALPHDQLFFEFRDESSPGVIRSADEKFTCVIMPVKIS